jgi:hypothetical protein
MEKLYYTPADKKLFWIVGYASKSDNVKGIISTLTNLYNVFFKVANVAEINTFVVEKSTRYDKMRVMYCTSNTPPKDAHILPDNVNMIDYINA